MELEKQSQQAIVAALTQALQSLAPADEQTTVVTDIYLQPTMGVGGLYVFDDDDNELAHAIVPEWDNVVPEDFYIGAETLLRTLLEQIQSNGDFENLPILKPYSLVLVDEERETVAELLLVDDETMMLSDGLLKGLDEELDSFLKQLLEE